MDATKRNKFAKIIITTLTAILSVYFIINGFIVGQTTGILSVSTPKGSIVAVYKTGYSITKVGVGSFRVRLAPGTYKVIVTGTAQSIKSVSIAKKQITNLVVNSLPAITPLDKYTVANKFIKLLPYDGPASEYEVTYSYQYTSAVAVPTIVITSPNSTDQQLAIKWIISEGFNPSTLPITYVTQAIVNDNYTNGLP